MTYTFVGNKDYVLEEIRKISSNFDTNNIISYNLDEDSIDKVIEEINTVSLFGNKLVEVFNVDKLQDFDKLIEYIDNPSDNTLILVSYKSLDNRLKSTKVLKEKTSYKELLSYDLNSYVKDNLDDYTMSFMNINLLINYCDNNISKIYNELEKLKIYKINEKEITSSDIENLVGKGYDSTIFNLIDCINLKDQDSVFKIYDELIFNGESCEKILYTIANHYRLLYQIKIKLENMSDDEIIKEYKMHKYRFSKLKEQGNLVSNTRILGILKSLSDIDISVKSGKRDISTGLFLFFKNL